jgi:hypothetical protein
MDVRALPASLFGKGSNRFIRKLILSNIALSADPDGSNSYQSEETLAAQSCCSSRHVRTVIKGLCELGLLEVKYKDGPHGTNRCQVILTGPTPGSPEFLVDPEAPGSAEPGPESPEFLVDPEPQGSEDPEARSSYDRPDRPITEKRERPNAPPIAQQSDRPDEAAYATSRLYNIGRGRSNSQKPFSDKGRRAIRVQLCKYSLESLIEAYTEFIEGRDDFDMSRAAVEFVEGASDILLSREREQTMARRIASQVAASEIERRKEVDAEIERVRREEAEEAELMEDLLTVE